MARSRRSRHRTASGNIWAVVGIIVVVCIFCGYVFHKWHQSQRVGTDSLSLCIDDSPLEYLAILIDTTDPLSPTQLRIARQIIEEKLTSVAVGTKINFLTVTPDLDRRETSFFGVCKPAAREQANQLYENPQLIGDAYQTQFITPIGKTLDQLLDMPVADSSPIIESIHSLASRIPGFVTSQSPRELVILSDLVQHSDSMSFFRGDSWKSFESSGASEAIGDLFAGAVVSVIRVPRELDRVDIVEDFWVNYFDKLGVVKINVNEIANIGVF